MATVRSVSIPSRAADILIDVMGSAGPGFDGIRPLPLGRQPLRVRHSLTRFGLAVDLG